MKKDNLINIKEEEIVTNNEDSLLDLFVNKTILSKNINKYCDDALKDMYDHNFYRAYKVLNNKEINLCKQDNKEMNRDFFKIESSIIQPLLENDEYEKEIDSALIIYNKIDIPINKNVVIKHLSKEDIAKDLIDLELRNYKDVYGEDFCIRKTKRFISKVSKSGLDFIAGYLNNRCVASCYIFNDGESISIDGLAVEEKYRHQKIASTLLQYVINNYDVPVFLHADEDDTPINMYKNMGFKIVNTKYYYFRKI